MDGSELLRAARRRWAVLAATVALALAAGWITTRVVPTGPPVKNYEATSVLLSSANPYGYAAAGTYNLKTLAAIATVGDVPQRVAESVGYEGDPLTLSERITASGNPETGILRITAQSTDPGEAERLANTFATELVTFLTTSSAETTSKQTDTLRKRIDKMRREIASLDRQIGASTTPSAVLTAERDAKVRQYSLLYEQFQQLSAQAVDLGQLQIIQDGVALPLADQGLLQVRSWPSRMLLSLILGLLAGFGLVFVLERLDTRINTKGAGERAFDLPVVAEIPLVRRWKRQRSGIAMATQPRSLVADAFRVLAAAVVRRPPRPPQVIMVTSPGPGDGKSTTVANLAAAYAELGRKVLVISADLHRPRVHTLFGIPNVSGLSEALRTRSDNGAVLDGQRWRTSLANVRVVPSGAMPEKPGELLASPKMKRVLAEAREVADIVLLDTAPILASSDAAHLFPLVDAVVVVARAGRTTQQAATRTTELLAGLGAPVVGAVLNATTEAVLPRGYYNYYAPRSRRGAARQPGGREVTATRGRGSS